MTVLFLWYLHFVYIFQELLEYWRNYSNQFLSTIFVKFFVFCFCFIAWVNCMKTYRCSQIFKNLKTVFENIRNVIFYVLNEISYFVAKKFLSLKHQAVVRSLTFVFNVEWRKFIENWRSNYVFEVKNLNKRKGLECLRYLNVYWSISSAEVHLLHFWYTFH